MESLDQNQVKEFYERVSEIWPTSDLWHIFSKRQIEKFLTRYNFREDSYILNAGSGGNDYGLNYNMHHIDIAENKINSITNATVSSIDSMPFKDEEFTSVICVGSVLNYCDAFLALSEIARVLQKSGELILEYESSWGYGYINNDFYKKSAVIVDVEYRGERHKQWLYSPTYIENILKILKMRIIKKIPFHICSGMYLAYRNSEQRAAKYAHMDKIMRYIPFINRHAHNIIMVCKK